jgi:ribonuclease P protein component
VAGRPSGGRSPKRRRLSRSADFERVYRQGRSKSNRFLVLYAFPREDQAEEGSRLGVSVSRRVGGAVDRTHVKRLLREAFWAEAERLPRGSDYVVVARPDARELAQRDGMVGVRASLGELVDMLGGAGDERGGDGGFVEPLAGDGGERPLAGDGGSAASLASDGSVAPRGGDSGSAAPHDRREVE